MDEFRVSLLSGVPALGPLPASLLLKQSFSWGVRAGPTPCLFPSQGLVQTVCSSRTGNPEILSARPALADQGLAAHYGPAPLRQSGSSGLTGRTEVEGGPLCSSRDLAQLQRPQPQPPGAEVCGVPEITWQHYVSGTPGTPESRRGGRATARPCCGDAGKSRPLFPPTASFSTVPSPGCWNQMAGIAASCFQEKEQT